MAIRGRYYYTREDDAYYKPNLVKIVDIVIYDAVLSFNVLYKGKPLADDL